MDLFLCSYSYCYNSSSEDTVVRLIDVHMSMYISIYISKFAMTFLMQNNFTQIN